MRILTFAKSQSLSMLALVISYYELDVISVVIN